MLAGSTFARPRHFVVMLPRQSRGSAAFRRHLQAPLAHGSPHRAASDRLQAQQQNSAGRVGSTWSTSRRGCPRGFASVEAPAPPRPSTHCNPRNGVEEGIGAAMNGGTRRVALIGSAGTSAGCESVRAPGARSITQRRAMAFGMTAVRRKSTRLKLDASGRGSRHQTSDRRV